MLCLRRPAGTRTWRVEESIRIPVFPVWARRAVAPLSLYKAEQSLRELVSTDWRAATAEVQRLREQ